MPALPDQPLIVQSDRSLLLEVSSPGFEAARDDLGRFAELEKSPEHIHTYRITALSLWNAAATGTNAGWVIEALHRHARYGVPDNVIADIEELMSRFGKLRLVAGQDGGPLILEVDDENIRRELSKNKSVAGLLEVAGDRFHVQPLARGSLKQRLARLGYPVDDRVGFVDGDALSVSFRDETLGGEPFCLRPYQEAAVAAFGESGLGHGVVVLPCGAGKTVVGMGAMIREGCETLILCTSITAVRQWISELLDKTSLTRDQIGEYSGSRKQIRPVTIATYSVLTHRKGERFTHFELFSSRQWGLIIYDEVHLLPAPVFRITAEIQARRRLGLTATLVREDGNETDVFSLIGPKRYDVPWKEMEHDGFIAEASCHEIRVEMPDDLKVSYAASADLPQLQFRLASENPAKDAAVEKLVDQHEGEGILVIGTFLAQLERLARTLKAPLITGKVAQRERERLYDAFRAGQVRTLVVSKVANFSVDLPDASVCIQVSGSYGSRQEEAQRLGRILRPKKRGAFFYTLVSRGSSEMRFAMNRQLFLTEQGYRYYIESWDNDATELDPGAATATAEAEASNVIPFPTRARP